MAYSASALKAVQTGIDLAIPAEMSTSEWADEFRGVERGARKGRWSNETCPYLVGIMDASDDPFVRVIVVQKPAQSGGTEAGNCIIGKRIHQEPTEIGYVGENEGKARAWTQEAFDTMVRATPVLQGLIYDTPEDNNQKVKRFPGGGLYILHASSPAELSSRPLQIVIFDEKAAYKPTAEGDPVKLGQARQKTYDGEELSIFISTPRKCACGPDETCGDISHDYERGDQREYYVPCPHCDEYQTLKFGGKDCNYGLKWDAETPESPYYICEHCQCVIEEFDREDMLAKGYWRASQPFHGVASFKFNQLYSPFVGWGKMVTDFLEAARDIKKLEVFTNTVLGEVWKPIQQIPYEQLDWRCEQYPAQVPPGVIVLTAGVDIQKDRIEAEIVGWGKGNESWSIDYKVLYGDTGVELALSDEGDEELEPLSNVWADLEEYLAGSFIGIDNNVYRVQWACIDSGYNTQRVYQFCKKHERNRWYAVKGMSDPFKPIVSKPKRLDRKPKAVLYPVGTNAAKDEVYSALRKSDPGPGYCHFPNLEHYNDAHWKQLGSERLVTHTRGGRSYRVYEKVSPGVRNEALDVRCYATVARFIMDPNYEAIERRRLTHAEVVDRDPMPDNDGPSEPPPTKPEPPSPTSRVLPFKTVNNQFEGYRP